MITDPKKFDWLVAEISIAAPITEEDVKRVLLVGSIVSVEKAASVAAMACMGMIPAAIGDMLSRYERAEAHMRKRLGDDFE